MGNVRFMLTVALSSLMMSSMPADIQSDSYQGVVRLPVEGRYLVALPEGYERQRRWPLIIFLHGSGERGTDLAAVKVHGPLKEIEQGRRIPAIVVAPQCPPEQWWDVPSLIGLLDAVERKYRVDRNRIVLTGLSMGGYGTWNWAVAQPNRFAAIAPICGGGNPARAEAIKHLPTWVVHGDADGAVPVNESRRMVEALRKLGANPRYDEIKGGGHDVWTDFYRQDEFYTWALAQRRK